MPKGVRKERIYIRKAAKLDEKVKSLEAALKEAKAERDLAYKEQLKEERKAEKELLKTAKESGVPYPELIDLIKAKMKTNKEKRSCTSKG